MDVLQVAFNGFSGYAMPTSDAQHRLKIREVAKESRWSR